MESTQGFLLAVGWFVLRFGLPVLATLAVCWFFRKLDKKWQEEGEAYCQQNGMERQVPTIRCWVLNDCPEAKREKCQAYLEQGIPCWQHFRSKNGELKERCLGCGVFRGSPVPESGD